MTTLALTSPIPPWRRWIAYITVALMPLSWNVEKLVGVTKPTYRSPLDYLLPVLVLLLLVDLLWRKQWASFKVPPAASLLWAGLAILSALWPQGASATETVKHALNPVFFGVLAVWVFQNLPGDATEYRRVALVLPSVHSPLIDHLR